MTARASSGRHWRRTIPLIAIGIAIGSGLIALGCWQLDRRAWKHRLMAQIEQRTNAAPIAAPGPVPWSDERAQAMAYRRVEVHGRFVEAAPVFVRALTKHGSGYWLIAPLRTDRGFPVLINRGFVSLAARRTACCSVDERPRTITGLLRLSEPGGRWFRRNDPATGVWYSRDVPSIAAAMGLSQAAPYFIDADASPTVGQEPIGGLTVPRFTDHHLVYALTWFGLAGLLAGGLVVLIRSPSPVRGISPRRSG